MMRAAQTSFFFFKQKTAYEIPLCDWSSDVCSSDLRTLRPWPRQGRNTLRATTCAEIGRASCRERVYSGVYISVVAVSLKKKEIGERAGGGLSAGVFVWWGMRVGG